MLIRRTHETTGGWLVRRGCWSVLLEACCAHLGLQLQTWAAWSQLGSGPRL